MRLEDANIASLSFLFKGEPACAKSPAAASFPDCYIFDFESRIHSVKQWWIPRGKKDIEFDTYLPTDFDKFDAKLDSLLRSCPYETVIFDTLTSMSDVVLQYVMNEKKKTPKAGKRIGKIDLNTIEDFGAEAAALSSFIQTLREIKAKHKILIAHVVRTEQKNVVNNSTTVTRQLMTAGKKVAAKLPGYFDEIYHFSNRPAFGSASAEYIVTTTGSGDDFARTTIGLPPEINFTDLSFYDLISANIEAALSTGGGNALAQDTEPIKQAW